MLRVRCHFRNTVILNKLTQTICWVFCRSHMFLRNWVKFSNKIKNILFNCRTVELNCHWHVQNNSTDSGCACEHTSHTIISINDRVLILLVFLTFRKRNKKNLLTSVKDWWTQNINISPDDRLMIRMYASCTYLQSGISNRCWNFHYWNMQFDKYACSCVHKAKGKKGRKIETPNRNTLCDRLAR